MTANHEDAAKMPEEIYYGEQTTDKGMVLHFASRMPSSISKTRYIRADGFEKYLADRVDARLADLAAPEKAAGEVADIGYDGRPVTWEDKASEYKTEWDACEAENKELKAALTSATQSQPVGDVAEAYNRLKHTFTHEDEYREEDVLADLETLMKAAQSQPENETITGARQGLEAVSRAKALEALDYIQHDWQQKDGAYTFQEQCEIIRALLGGNTGEK
jgi:hypothetical protein